MNDIIIAIIGSGALTALITNAFNIYRDRRMRFRERVRCN